MLNDGLPSGLVESMDQSKVAVAAARSIASNAPPEETFTLPMPSSLKLSDVAASARALSQNFDGEKSAEEVGTESGICETGVATFTCRFEASLLLL